MSRIVFLLEEPSMKHLLDGLLPRLFPGVPFLCVPHEGKTDLEKSIPRKLRAWREPGVHFVVVRDNDGRDCRALKASLVNRCLEACNTNFVVRIACQELEAWYLGEPEALAEAYGMPELRNLSRRRKFRNSDAVPKPSKELEGLVPEFQKVAGARLMAGRLTRERNESASFRALMTAVEGLAAQLGTAD